MPDYPDIQVLDAHTRGRTIIVGDIHGAPAFRELISSLDSNDRLISVGDLADRGADSKYAIETARTDPRIFVVLGNHEAALSKFIANGKLILNMNGSGPNSEYNQACEERRYYTNPNIGGAWALDLDDDEIKRVDIYLKTLPTVIKLPDAYVVHSDLPISTQELEYKIANNDFSLTPDEKFHAMWARTDDRCEGQPPYRITTREEEAETTPIYYGHEITWHRGVAATRAGGRINLDFGAYHSGILVAVEHTPNRKIILYGNPSFQCSETTFNTFFARLDELRQKISVVEFRKPEQLYQYLSAMAFLKKNSPHVLTNCRLAFTFTSQAEVNQYLKSLYEKGILNAEEKIDLSNCTLNGKPINLSDCNPSLTFSSKAKLLSYLQFASRHNILTAEGKIDLSGCDFDFPDFIDIDLRNCIFARTDDLRKTVFTKHCNLLRTQFPDGFTVESVRFEAGYCNAPTLDDKQNTAPAMTETQWDLTTATPAELETFLAQISTTQVSDAQTKGTLYWKFGASGKRDSDKLNYIITKTMLNFFSSLSVENANNTTERYQLGFALRDLADAQTTRVSCIQMPIALNRMWKKEFLQLIIFYKSRTQLGAYIIDSTSNRIGIPTNDVTKILICCQWAIEKLFGISSQSRKAEKIPLTTIHTGVRSMRQDQQSALYVAAGIYAINRRIATEGTEFLKDKSRVERAITLEHQLAQRMSAASYTEYRIRSLDKSNLRNRIPITDSNARLLEKFSQNPTEATAAVKSAITEYLENSRQFGVGFWRHFLTGGQKYAAEALARLTTNQGNQTEIAYAIAEELFMMGYNSNTAKHNNPQTSRSSRSRIDYLISALDHVATSTITPPPAF